MNNSLKYLSRNRNKKLLENGLTLLRNLPPQSVSACFFDPQYRAIMDKMNYGNEGKSRQSKRIALPQMSNTLITEFLIDIAQAIKPGGYVFFWMDKYTLAEGIHITLLEAANRNLEPRERLIQVDMITWDKGRIAQGYRSRGKSEFCLILQKWPKGIKTWKNKSIPDVWTEKILQPRKGHPHKKPTLLLLDLIRCVTQERDVILDPCAGSFITFDLCKVTNRNFIGCDISPEYTNQLPTGGLPPKCCKTLDNSPL